MSPWKHEGKKSNSMASISKEKKILICCEEVVTIFHSIFALGDTQYQLVFLSSFFLVPFISDSQVCFNLLTFFHSCVPKKIIRQARPLHSLIWPILLYLLEGKAFRP
jgi:hypothetical protein